jgi:uncharacterized protein with PQ loop repeat
LRTVSKLRIIRFKLRMTTGVTGETDDLSKKMLLLLGIGLALWLVYGFMRGDVVIVVANGASLAMLSVIGALKLRSSPGSNA